MSETKFSKDEIFQQSIVFVGPAGVGKSLCSWKMGERLNLPVITMDYMRDCPTKIEEIESKKEKVEKRISYIEEIIDFVSEGKSRDLGRELSRLKNECWVYQRQIEMRKILPNLPNYKQMGFKKDVSKFLNDNFGAVAWHYYQKQFENRLLKTAIEQIDRPVIFDLGGGMAISLDKDYKILDKELRGSNEKLYLQNFNSDEIGFEHIKNLLEPFKNVVFLNPPKDYKTTMNRAGRDKLNETFLKTRQYDEVATLKEDTTGLIKGSSYNEKRLNEILDDVEDCREKTIQKSNTSKAETAFYQS